MAIREDKATIYTIPENFIDESRVLKGMFKARNLFEGLIMAGVVAFFALLIPAKELTTKITIVVTISTPFLFVGVLGFNGDPISTTINNALRWRRERALILFNNKPRPLTQSPITAMMEREDPKDKLLDYFEKVKAARAEKNNEKEMIEGVDYEFENDDDLISGDVSNQDGEEAKDSGCDEEFSFEESNDIYIDDDLHTQNSEQNNANKKSATLRIKPDSSVNLMKEDLF